MSRILESIAPSSKLISRQVYAKIQEEYPELKDLTHSNMKKRLSKINNSDRAYLAQRRQRANQQLMLQTPQSSSALGSATAHYAQINLSEYCKHSIDSLEKYKSQMQETDYMLLRTITQLAS